MSRRKICASIQVLLYVSLLLLCALCSAETVENEIDAPISSVRRLLAAPSTVFINKGESEVIAVEVPAGATVRDMKRAANLLPSQGLTFGGVELTDDAISLAEAGIGAEAVLYVEDREYVELTFLVDNTEILRSILQSISEPPDSNESDDDLLIPITLQLTFNRPIFDEIRNQLALRYGAVDAEYSPVIYLEECTGDDYTDVQLVRVNNDFRQSVDVDDELTMVNVGTIDSRGRARTATSHLYESSPDAPQLNTLIFIMRYGDIRPNFAFAYKNREPFMSHCHNSCYLHLSGVGFGGL